LPQHWAQPFTQHFSVVPHENVCWQSRAALQLSTVHGF